MIDLKELVHTKFNQFRHFGRSSEALSMWRSLRALDLTLPFALHAELRKEILDV